MRKFLPLLLLSVLPLVTKAQYDESEDLKNNHPLTLNELTAKLELANIVNPNDPAVIGAVEYQYKPWRSFSQEVGFIVGLRGFEEEDDVFGVKIREEWRSYFASHLITDGLMYISGSVQYRYLEARESTTVGYGCGSDWKWSCTYLRGVESLVKTHRYGGSLRIGVMKYLSPHLVIEADLGFAMQNMMIIFDDHGADQIFNDDNFFNQNQEGWRISPMFSAKVGYVFKRKPLPKN